MTAPVTDPYHVLLKPRGAICDLECRYCYYLEKERLYPGSDFRMSDEVLEAFTRQYILSQRTPEIVFGWQGGEPTLMGLDFFRRAVALQRKHAPPGVRVLNSLQTNGMRLDAEWCAFLREHGFLVGISIDGPAEVHDAYRVDKGGKPTHAGVLAGLDLLQRHGVAFNVLTTVHAANAGRPLEVYRYLRDEIGATYLQFIPVVEPAGNSASESRPGVGPVTGRSVGGKAYGAFLSDVFDEWVHGDVGTVFVQIFDVALAAWVGVPPGLCIFQEECGRALAVEHNGDAYSCDHFVTPEHLLGNVRHTELPVLVDGARQHAFGRAKKETLPRQCRECEVRFVCNGGCPKNRIATASDGEAGLNILCEGYRPFFNHVAPAMRFMADALRRHEPPSSIMNALARGSDPTLSEVYPPRRGA
ncbi:MAG: anaerobic sulfatase maturase [Gemmatimonadetes bacterium]|nr:anaerobic sulfatase maturase [Gemmatimonadota bacterium]